MSRYLDINRRNERFPAFSDEIGVKNDSRPAFKSDESWIMSENQDDSLVLDSPDGQEIKQLRRVNKSIIEKRGYSYDQNDELAKHKRELPDYNARNVTPRSSAGTKQLITEKYSWKNSSSTSIRSHTMRSKGQTTSSNMDYDVSRSRFIPKYVPSSIIKEEPKSAIDASILYKSMKKESESYLLFTNESDDRDKNPDHPSINRFQSLEDTNQHVENHKIAFHAKQKKRNVLEKSLDGMIQEGQSQLDSNGYFKK